MQAVVCTEYGNSNVLSLKEVDKPVPKNKEVLVKIHASSINYGNLVLLKGQPYLARLAFGLFKPKYSIPGGDIAGQVESIGNKVNQLQLGDEVFGDLSAYGWGGFAEYVCVPEGALALKPNNVSYEEAAAVPMAGVTALQALRNKGNIQPGQKVLIYGASGGVGTFAVQIAKAFDAEVTGVCSTRNVEILRSIGADHVIDYQKENFSQSQEKYDLILGVNGNQPLSIYKRALNPNGIFLHVGGSGEQLYQTMIQGPWTSIIGSKKIGNILQRANQKDLIYIKELLESGSVKPVIDRKYKLSEIADAFNYFSEGHAQGKVVITV
ncbi:NAD(P)-dependent alcohol dehydrogenase [Robertmurraya korlensis]|uniref:NAD(P)-dependent alcohol dehydrogenase n=1 Tax=Robertmurraya korlensis TaxID=519977 RepID=UPI0008261B31|nr:NAD(P)-dependent alcohol dehydrogenase [Robertmurraya korlensis]